MEDQVARDKPNAAFEMVPVQEEERVGDKEGGGATGKQRLRAKQVRMQRGK